MSDDLIPREDVRDFLTNAMDHALAKCGVPDHRMVTDLVLGAVVPALPADPVAAVAVELAEVKSTPRNIIGTSHNGYDVYHGFECSTCGHKWYPSGPVNWPRTENHHEACPAGRYRAAKEAAR